MDMFAGVLPLAGADAMSLSDMILSNLPWIVMLVLGFVLVIIEMYVPGFGLPGISGLILLIVSVIMVSRGDMVMALVMSVIIIALLCVVLSISIRSAAKGRLYNSKLVLHEVFAPEVGESDMRYFIGKTGVTHTVLRPAGIGEFDGVKLNIVSDGEFIAAGETVKVERVEGNRIFVRKAVDVPNKP